MRAPPLLLLLLMAGAGLAATPLVALNPWLSACDLDAAVGADQCGSPCGNLTTTLEARNVARLCGLSRKELSVELYKLRLRTCCERSAWSALDTTARQDVLLQDRRRCQATLHSLVELDALVARVHCDFREVLTRYDCNQTYSVHSCDQCQDTYRKWACSTLVPWWLEREDSGGRSRRAPPEHWSRFRARHLERVGHLDRRRGWPGSAWPGGTLGRWVRAAAAGPGRPARSAQPVVRIKPCLSTCQLVEQHCPYFLPADRAPAYPTQYAGEPTFLCLDERIPETGEQAERSNYGREDCCYYYTGNESNPLNHNCSLDLEQPVRPPAETCQPTPSREPNCPLSRAGPRTPSPILLALLTLAVHLRTFWTASQPVNVRDSRL